MHNQSETKAERILTLYDKLKYGEVIHKEQFAMDFNVSTRTIQRDITDIQHYLDHQNIETGSRNEVAFSKNAGGYKLNCINQEYLDSKEILAISKILLDSRALMKSELFPIIEKLIDLCGSDIDGSLLEELLRNEMFHYVELQHGKRLLDKLWTLEQAIKNKKYLRVKYQKLQNQESVIRKLKPVGLMFSDFYFYLTAYIDFESEADKYVNPEDGYPTIYRVDRFLDINVLEERFVIPYAKRFEEGEFKKRIQFMHGGSLHRVQMECQEQSLEAVLDRLPTAEIIDKRDGKYIIKAETFGKGIDLWIEGQGDSVKKI